VRLRTILAVRLILNREPSEKEKTPTDDNQTQRPLTAMYCKEEGLEGLQQRYIKVHGFCRLPRAHAHGSGTGKEKCNCYRHARSGTGLEEDGKCNCCNLSRLADCPEEALRKKQLLHCQKGQYMLVRLPPHCKVKWNDRDRFHDELTRFHAKQRLGLIEVRFGRSRLG
jgi:hypothetical protein